MFYQGIDEISQMKMEIESIEKEIPAFQGKVREMEAKYIENDDPSEQIERRQYLQCYI
jgi:hypothetical protein